MWRIVLSAVCGVLTCWNVAAQDLILKRDAEQIAAIVTEITDSEVKYKRFSAPEGVTYAIPKSDIFSITYRNGEKELYGVRTGDRADDYPYPRVSRSYRVGEIFDEDGVRGLVIRVSDGGRHGLLLSLVEGKAAWGGAWGENRSETFQAFDSRCSDLEDGWKNMQTIADLIANTSLLWSNFPAFDWCRDLGPGWYLPARKEIELLWNFGDANPAHSLKEHRSAVRNLTALLEGAGELGFTTTYFSCWTSTQSSAKAAHVWINVDYMQKAYTRGWAKSGHLSVRAVHKF